MLINLRLNNKWKMKFVQLLGSVVTLLHTDKEVLYLIPGSAMEFFSSGELFQGMYRLGVSVF